MVHNVLVAGGGVMGSGIALACALGGQRVHVLDVDAAALDRVRQAVTKKWQFMVRAGLAGTDSQAAIAAIGYLPAAELESAAPAMDICFEAVPDDLALKRSVIGRLNAVLRPAVPIATNSGNLLVTEVAAELADRRRVLSAHWINPPHLMPPVEVSPGPDTDPAAVTATVQCLLAAGKRPVRLRRDIPGRIANRLHFAMLNEAIKLVEEDVASPEDIDAVARFSFIARHALFGPLGAHDLYGRKRTSIQNFAYLYEVTGNPCYQPTRIHQEKVALEAAGDVAASHWRPGLEQLDREECDRRVVDLIRFLGEGGGDAWS